MIGVVIVDVRHEFDLGSRLRDRLPHFESDQSSEYLALCAVQLGDPLDHINALTKLGTSPTSVGVSGPVDGGPGLAISDLGELCDLLAGCRIDSRVDTHSATTLLHASVCDRESSRATMPKDSPDPPSHEDSCNHKYQIIPIPCGLRINLSDPAFHPSTSFTRYFMPRLLSNKDYWVFVNYQIPDQA